jgi:hypothetical protein
MQTYFSFVKYQVLGYQFFTKICELHFQFKIPMTSV